VPQPRANSPKSNRVNTENSARITGDAHPGKTRPKRATSHGRRRCRQTEVGKVAKVAQATSNLNGMQPAEDATGPYDVIARDCRRPVCLGRRSGRLVGHGWLGQGFQQRPDLPVGVASVAA